ncbi:MAG: hypothetical protein ACJ788_19045 [Ktedonobacteraceae bacterium]
MALKAKAIQLGLMEQADMGSTTRQGPHVMSGKRSSRKSHPCSWVLRHSMQLRFHSAANRYSSSCDLKSVDAAS